MADISTRDLGPADHDAFHSVLKASFLDAESDEARERSRAEFGHARSLGAFDGDELIGGCAALDRTLIVPGATGVPVAAVTNVGVAPGHRRRGVLRALMREQLRGLRGRAPIAALYASEGGIYGRFGYGPATQQVRLAVPRGARFRPDVAIDERPVREVGLDRGLAAVAEHHPAIAADRVGWFTRHDEPWRLRTVEAPGRGGQGPVRCAVHPGGYALYRAEHGWGLRGPSYALHVTELAAETPQAYAALVRYLLDVDLVAEVRWSHAAVDEPVLAMLADPRQALREVTDGIWVRLVDLPAALTSRRYPMAGPVDAVLDVTDAVCPWNAGRWRLRIADGVAEVTRSEAAPSVALDVADLGAVHLGGTTLGELGRAGRIAEHSPGALQQLSRAFAGDRPPHCPEQF
ncbi:GNAT family N-acetyltransferase [Saccharopolyspora cebuensis]|uniref:GNAT family N-acetyltransferase n=1 Tax=Saccharopolyspora cebuensis TaxID=418759 RepID=A0ABV4CGF7_9PSEU